MSERPKLIIHSASASSNVWTLKNNLDYAWTVPMDGMVMNGASGWNLMKPGVVIGLEDTRNQMAGFEAFNAARHNYFLVQTDDPGDLFDDAAWAQVVENFRIVAQAAREAGYKGLIFDNEEYQGQWQNFPEHYENADPSNLATYQEQAALRGRQIMEAIAEAFPEAEIGVMHGPYASVFQDGQPDAITGQMGGPQFHELRGPFFTGMAEGLGPDQTLIDMGELYALRSDADFAASQAYRSDTLPDLFDWPMPQEIRDNWDDLIVQSHMLITSEFPAGFIMTPGILEETLVNAYRNSEEVVFIFSNPGEEDWFTPGALDPDWLDAVRGATERADAADGVIVEPLGDGLRVTGTHGDDAISATNFDDLLVGRGGDDLMAGGAGDDRFRAGLGNDTVRGGAGDDLLLGQPGADHLIGGGGADRIWGGTGDDVLRGADGNDRLRGGAGADVIWGGAGADVFIFRPGDDTARIADFDPGLDRIRIVGERFDRLDITEDGGATIIRFDGGEIVLSGIRPAEIDAGDFLF